MTQEKEGKARTNLEIAEYALAGFLMSQEALDASARLIRQVKEALDQKDTIIQSLEKRFDTAQHYDNLLVMEDNYNKIASLEKQVERLKLALEDIKYHADNPFASENGDMNRKWLAYCQDVSSKALQENKESGK